MLLHTGNLLATRRKKKANPSKGWLMLSFRVDSLIDFVDLHDHLSATTLAAHL